ncbi:hypothetical protein LOK49_LG10G01998 [Camellia lanceoleosa]|uniref:Uncharacterized protein n=1 Tax=Camellia lanceoleosa TaxID=1840588 RepID=A0ACC0GAF7_9ERIC|nr:hypothetical protein LOK49_LG10G01998 [Camellia lanceoleosa]
MKFWFGSLFCWLVSGPAVGSGVAAAAGPWVMICSGCLPVMAVVGRFFSGFFPVVAGVAAPDKAEVEKVFNHFNANDDGKILATKLISVMKALQSNTSENEMKRMMEELDTDLDGFISLEELASFYKGGNDTVEAVGDDGGMAGLKDAFKLYD